MQNSQYSKAKYFTSADSVCVSLGLIVAVGLSLLATLIYVIGISAVYTTILLVAALLAPLVLPDYAVDFPFIRIGASTGDIVAQCPHCRAVLISPRSIPLISCAECSGWIRILGMRVFAITHADALDFAATSGLTDSVRTLIAQGTDVNAKDQSGSSALKSAVCGGHLGIVRILLEGGAEVNAKAEDSSTPLMFAVASGRTDIVEELLQWGADTNAKNNLGITALRIAEDTRSAPVIALLKRNQRKQ